MVATVDFSKYRKNGKFYGGSERKEGITIDGIDYMVKYQKKTAFGKRNNHISEFLGSHIFELCGLKAHDTYLGYRGGEQVVVCRDFNEKGKQFVPFNDVGESTLEQDKESYLYEYSDIQKMLRDNSKMTNVEDTVSMFWNIYIVDAYLGNFDRHGANWGFLKENNHYSLAPVFDNGSCLFPNLVDEAEMRAIMDSEEETAKHVYQFPTSQIKLMGKKSSYFEVINSLQYEECNKALENIVERLDIGRVEDLVAETPFLSETQMAFYTHILDARYRMILLSSYEKLRQRR